MSRAEVQVPKASANDISLSSREYVGPNCGETEAGNTWNLDSGWARKWAKMLFSLDRCEQFAPDFSRA